MRLLYTQDFWLVLCLLTSFSFNYKLPLWPIFWRLAAPMHADNLYLGLIDPQACIYCNFPHLDACCLPIDGFHLGCCLTMVSHYDHLWIVVFSSAVFFMRCMSVLYCLHMEGHQWQVFVDILFSFSLAMAGLGYIGT